MTKVTGWELTDEETRRMATVVLVVLQPFVEDEDDEISEDREQEDYLWNELKQNLQVLPEKPVNKTNNNVVTSLPQGGAILGGGTCG